MERGLLYNYSCDKLHNLVLLQAAKVMQLILKKLHGLCCRAS